MEMLTCLVFLMRYIPLCIFLRKMRKARHTVTEAVTSQLEAFQTQKLMDHLISVVQI